MFLFGLEREEDEYQFLRNLRLMATQDLAHSRSRGKRNASTSTAPALQNLLHDLSFWDDSQVADDCVSTQNKSSSGSRRRHRSRTQLSSRTSSTDSTASSSFATSQNSIPEETTEQHQRTELNEGNNAEGAAQQAIWKTAVDPVSGRTYYYDAITRITQWNKPPELRALEQRRRREQRERDAAFFKEMESNLMKSLARGELTPGIPRKDGPSDTAQLSPREPLSPGEDVVKPTIGKVPSRVRTISGMDEVLLAELRDDGDVGSRPIASQRPPLLARPPVYNDKQMGRPPRPRRSQMDGMDALELSPDPEPIKHQPLPHPLHRHDSEAEPLAGELLLDEPIQSDCKLVGVLSPGDKPAAITQHSRRNTGGTIYIQNTLYNPDIQATIKCICGVYRAHIVQAAEQRCSQSPQCVTDCDPATVEVFCDDYGSPYSNFRDASIPTFNEVLSFYEAFYKRSQMEHDTIIMSLIYVERLTKATNGALQPAPHNWRSILFSCMVLASKVWDDLSMWNIDFSNVSAATRGLTSFTLPRINQLELALLTSLNFDVRVPASEYAKYYFLIRTMLLRSGLVNEGATPLQRKPGDELTVENKTNQYQNRTVVNQHPPVLPIGKADCKLNHAMGDALNRPRFQSLDGVLAWLANANNKTGPVLRDTVCLEQLVG